jgi:hypothetical protein
MFSHHRAALFLAGTLLATSGCGGNGSLPGSTATAGASQFSASQNGGVGAADTTSILKKLVNDTVIGSTVDPGNGDKGPHSLAIVPANYGLKKGQLLACNFADSSGTAGNGTTVEVLNATPGSSPKTFATNAKIKGCDANAISGSGSNQVYACGLTAGDCIWLTQKGKYKKTYGSPIVAPFADGDIYNPYAYAAEYIMVGDSKTGGVVSFAIGPYGNPKETQVISGFGASGSGWSTLGPSGFQYDHKKDVMYIADGDTNTIISVSHPGNLLLKNEIVVQPGGKTFKCAHPKDACAKLVKAGKPLNGPVALVLLHNGNLIAANTKGGNTLVELTPSGQVLATKVIDQGSVPAIFGLAAIGKSDSTTALFYTDTNDNSVHELTQ